MRVYITDKENILIDSKKVDDSYIPADFEYTDPPPENKKGFAIVMTEIGWVYAEDNRHKIYYDPISGLPYQHLKLGAVPKSFATTPKPTPYHIWDGKKWALNKQNQNILREEHLQQIRNAINTKRDACVNGGVYVPEIEKWVDTDEKGRATLVEIKADFDLNGKEDNGEPRIFTLICADNTAEPLDFDKFKAVWNACKTLKEKMFENAYMHKVLLEAEENPTEYDWSIGWSQTYEEHKNAQEK